MGESRGRFGGSRLARSKITPLYTRLLCLWIRRDSVGLIEMAAEVVLLRYGKQSIFFRASPRGAGEQPNGADRGAQRYLAAVARDESF